MKPAILDFLRRLLFWKNVPRKSQWGTVEAGCVYIPTAEKQTTI